MILTLEARIGNLEAEMKKATNSVDKFTKTAKDTKTPLASFGSALKGLAATAGLTLGLQQVIAFMGEAGKAAAQDAKSFELMAQTMRNVTQASEGDVAASEAQIQKLSLLTGVVDDNLRPAFATLVRTTKDSTEAMNLLKTAQDIAAGTGRSLTTVSLALAKAHDGNFAALNKLVPGIKNAKDPMAQLTQQFAGMAEKAANTDPYMRMNTALDNIKETVGKALLPSVRRFANFLASDEFQADIQKASSVLDDFLTGIMTISDNIGSAVTDINKWLGSLGVNIDTKAIDSWAKKLIGIYGLFSSIVAIGGAANEKANLPDETNRLIQQRLNRLGALTVDDKKGDTGGAVAKKVDPFVTYLQNTQKQILDARATYDKAVADANDKYGALIKKYSDDMAKIIEDSMNRLRDVFATATATDVGAIFSNLAQEGDATADLLLKRLQDKLAAGKKLAENAAALAGLGYSQTFIEQVIAQGTDTGNALAEALKVASPETAKALQDTFKASETLSNTGMDNLAKSLYEKSGLATDQLKSLFDAAQNSMVQAQTDLSNALLAAVGSLNDSLTKIEATFTAKLASMGSKAKAYQTEIQKTFGLLATNFVDTGVSSVADIAPVAGLGGVRNMRPASVGGGQVFNITTTANTNASAETIAQATLNAAKFGIPAVI
jgi:phage host-nuclease inhibitor protein Gam